jgi:hypothetical protein
MAVLGEAVWLEISGQVVGAVRVLASSSRCNRCGLLPGNVTDSALQ